MNTAQLQSLVRWLLNSISGGVIAYTAAKSPAAKSLGEFASNLITGPDVVSGLMLGITWLWGHITHAKDSPPTSSGSLSSQSVPLFLLSCLIGGTLFFSGCSTTTPQQVTYQAAGTTVVSVDTAMHLWGAYVAAEHPPVSQELAVKNAFEKYQVAMVTMCDAGAAYSAAGGTNGTAAAALNSAIANSSQELIDLQNLITSFGVKLQ